MFPCLKVFNKASRNSLDPPKASHQPCSWEGIPHIRKVRKPVEAGKSGKRKKEVVKEAEKEVGRGVEKEKRKEESSSEDGDVEAKPRLHLPSKRSTNVEDSDYTDNSSGKTERVELVNTGFCFCISFV